MNKVIQEQLEMLKDMKFEIDGVSCDSIPSNFNNIVFKSNIGNTSNMKIKVVFEDYIVKPFNGFDFHEKFNKGNPPPFKFMKGVILKETEKMYYFKLVADEFSSAICNHCLDKNANGYICNECSKIYPNLESVEWYGWCPKKSCRVS